MNGEVDSSDSIVSFDFAIDGEEFTQLNLFVSDQLSGFVEFRTTDQTLEFRRLFVHWNLRRKAYGTWLIRALVNSARQLGKKAICATVHSVNADSRKFYASLGFVEITKFSSEQILIVLSIQDPVPKIAQA